MGKALSLGGYVRDAVVGGVEKAKMATAQRAESRRLRW